jgi:hypothetical protein
LLVRLLAYKRGRTSAALLLQQFHIIEYLRREHSEIADRRLFRLANPL